MSEPVSITSPERDHSTADALGLWEPKRTLTLEAARRHTQRIQILRKVLLGLAGLLAIVLVFQFFEQGTTTFDNPNPTESVKMVSPRYSGRTSDALPFYLTAETATRTMDRQNEVDLVKPILEFIRARGAASSFILSETGVYDDMEKVLNLEVAVNLETDDGYFCQSTHARIFARNKRIEGDEPINCKGNFGKVNGEAFEINDNYTKFIFKDGMNAIINGDPATNTPLENNEKPFAFGGNGPIDVKAERAVYVRGTTDLFGGVKVVQDGATITSNEMKILRNEAPPATDGSIRLGEVNKIIAVGDFHYFTAQNDVRGEQGIYERDKNLITVTGNVRVKQPDGNMAITDRLTYDTNTETIRFSGQCQGPDCRSRGANRIIIPGKKTN